MKQLKRILFVLITVLAFVFGFSIKTNVKAATNTEPAYGWYLNKNQSTKIDGTNYYGLYVQFADAVAPKIGGDEEYWGIKVYNPGNSLSKIRYNFRMSGGKQLWIPSNGYAYLVSKTGDIVKQEWTGNLQRVDIPAGFEGYVYVKKSTLINYSNYVQNDESKYAWKCYGPQVFFDYRASGNSELVVYSMHAANFTEVDETITISDARMTSNLDEANGSAMWLNQPSDTSTKPTVEGLFKFKKYALADLDFEHTCNHICTVCGKCNDATCTSVMCSDKCAGHVIDTPVLTLDGNVVSWTAVSNAVSYDVYVDGEKVGNQTALSYTVNETSGSFKVKVMAIAATDYTNSAMSSEKTVDINVAHVCGHACPLCGKCMDETCTDEVCAQKCDGECNISKGTPQYGILVSRESGAVIANSNYAVAYIMADYGKSPKLNGSQEYWGMVIENKSELSTRVRFGFVFGGGVNMFMGPAGSVCYLVSEDGKVTLVELTSAQFVDIPGGFKGTVYIKGSQCYNYDKYANDPYQNGATKTYAEQYGWLCKGVAVAFDYRLNYTASILVKGLAVADISAAKEVTNYKFRTNFDQIADTLPAANINKSNLGTINDANVKSAMQAAFFVAKVALVDETKTISALNVIQAKKTEFLVGEEHSRVGGYIGVKYSNGLFEVKSLSNSMFSIEGFDSSAVAAQQIVTVKAGDKTATYTVKIVDHYASADDEEGQYVMLDRFNNTKSDAKTGFLCFQYAMEYFLANDKNATGTGNCIALRIENVGDFSSNFRIELRAKNSGDAAGAATHRTTGIKNCNQYVWFVADGSSVTSSLVFDKTNQVITIPAHTAGTIYMRYDTDFSWKGHTAEYGISHVAICIDMRGTATPKIVLKEVYDATYYIKDNAQYTDIQDMNKNGANVNTHFTTDVVFINNKRLLSTKTITIPENVTVVAPTLGTQQNSKEAIQILCDTDYFPWTESNEDTWAEETAKVRFIKYNPLDWEVVSIAVTTMPKAQYEIGALEPDWSQGKVTVTYKSGRTEEFALTSTRFEVSGFDSLEAADSQVITVLYKSLPTISTTFNVKIAAPVQPSEKKGCGSSITASCLAGIMLLGAAFALRRKERNI